MATREVQVRADGTRLWTFCFANAAAALLLGAGAASAAGALDEAPAPGERAITPVQTAGPSPAAGARDHGGDGDAAPTPTTGVNFLAIRGGAGGVAGGAESGFIPPDTTGAVGESSIIVPLNGRIKIFSKTGSELYSATLDDFFSSVLPSGFAFDPRVEYDAITGRWVVIAVNGGANNSIMIATSNSATPTAEADFTFRAFVHSAVIPGDAGEFADYPTLATDANSVLIGTNNFAASYNSSSLFVIDKSDLIAGTLTVTGFQNVGTTTSGVFTPQPVENDDPTATESYMVGVDQLSFGQLNFRRVTYPGGTPTLSAEIPVTVPATSGSGDDVPAQGSSTPIDALDDRLYEAMMIRDPAGVPKMWTAHNMEVNSSGVASATGGRIGSRWYEFANLGATPTLVQSGTLFDPAAASPDSYWVPSIAASGQGHAVLGSSVAGPNRFAGVALAQRFAGEAAGTLGPVNFAQPGANSYTLLDSQNRNRWGDYSQVSIDPTDNMTFWTFQEYVHQGGAALPDQWGVRVIEVKAPPPATPSSSTGAASNSASTNVTVTGTSSNGSGFYEPGASFPKHISATVSGGVTVNSVTVNGPTQLTLSLNTTAAANGPKDVTVTNPDGQTATGAGVLVVGDIVPPETTITKKPKKKTEKEKAKLKFTSNEVGSTFECKLDKKSFKDCDSPKKLKNLKVRKHKFLVRAVDAAGNVDPTAAKAKWKVLED